MEQPKKFETFAQQAFGGFFGVCWAILGLMLIFAMKIILSGAGVEDGGYFLLGFVLLMAGIILLVVKINREQRRRRGLD